MEGVIFIFIGLGLLWFIFNSFRRTYKENTEKSGETFKDLLEKGAKYQQVRQDQKPKNTGEEPLTFTILVRIVAPILLMLFIVVIYSKVTS